MNHLSEQVVDLSLFEPSAKITALATPWLQPEDPVSQAQISDKVWDDRCLLG